MHTWQFLYLVLGSFVLDGIVLFVRSLREHEPRRGELRFVTWLYFIGAVGLGVIGLPLVRRELIQPSSPLVSLPFTLAICAMLLVILLWLALESVKTWKARHTDNA